MLKGVSAPIAIYRVLRPSAAARKVLDMLLR
jgi:hypothetical protein